MTPYRYPTNFEDFMAEVDAELEAQVGMMHLDLPDFDYATAFENRHSAAKTARRAIIAAGGF